MILFHYFRYCQGIEKGPIEKWKRINYQYVLLNLTEILLKFDLGDETGRQNLKNLFISLITKEDIEEKTVENIVRCVENLIPLTSDRMQYFVDIIRNCCNLNSRSNTIDLSDATIAQVLDKDQNLKVRVTSLKFKIMELKEQESDSITRKEYEKTSKITEELNLCNEEITSMIRSALMNSGSGESFSVSKNNVFLEESDSLKKSEKLSIMLLERISKSNRTRVHICFVIVNFTVMWTFFDLILFCFLNLGRFI